VNELCLMTILIILIELEVETSQTKATDEKEIAFSSVNRLKRKKSDQLIESPPITFPFFNQEERNSEIRAEIDAKCYLS
jgi:hypothetical protein